MDFIMKNKKRKISKLDTFLEMPKEVVSDEPKFTIVGFSEILIENYKNILEYYNFILLFYHDQFPIIQRIYLSLCPKY